MEPKNLVLFVNSSQFHAGTDLVCAMVAAKVTDYARTVTLSWTEEAYDPSRPIILAKGYEVTIPANERSALCELPTDATNFGGVELIATIEGEQPSDPQQFKILASEDFRQDSIPIVISLFPFDNDTDQRIEPNAIVPIDRTIRLQVSEVPDNDGEIKAQSLPKNLTRDVTLSLINARTGRLMGQPSSTLLFLDPPAPFMPARVDDSFFTFRIDARNLANGTYSVAISIILTAQDTDGRNYGGLQPITLYFIK